MTKGLVVEDELNETEKDIFTTFQFSGGAAIVNFFGSVAILFTLTDTSEASVPGSTGIALTVIFLFKIVSANLMRFYLKVAAEKQDSAKTAEAI